MSWESFVDGTILAQRDEFFEIVVNEMNGLCLRMYKPP